MTDHFPTFRRIARLNWRRILRWFAALLVGVPLLAYAALRVNVEIARWRAEQLLDEIRTLRLHESTFEEVQRIADQFPANPGFPETEKKDCTPSECDLAVGVTHMWLWEIPDWLEHAGQKVSIRQWATGASIQVRRGLIRQISFAVVTVNGEEMLTVGGGSVPGFHPFFYQRELMDRSQNYFPQILPRPNFFQVSFTADATSDQVRRSLDFHLDCLSSLRPCTRENLVPSAWRDASVLHKMDFPWPPATPCGKDTLTRLARDGSNIHLVEVVRVHPFRNGDSTGSRFVDYQLIRTIKGELDRPLQRMRHQVLSGAQTADPERPELSRRLFRPGNRVLLFLEGGLMGSVPDADCGVIEATEENLAIVERVLERERERNARTWPPKQ